MRVAQGRILILSSFPDTQVPHAWMWAETDDVPVECARPIDPAPSVGFLGFDNAYRPLPLDDENAIVAIGSRIDIPPKIIPFQKFTLGEL